MFRAEKSNTHRHLTEFTGLDLEMVSGGGHHVIIQLITYLLFCYISASSITSGVVYIYIYIYIYICRPISPNLTQRLI